MLIGLLGTSQNGFRIPDDEHAIFSVYADYADSKVNGYGPNIGAEFGYSGFVEAKVGFETFPQLYGGYIDVHGAIGFKMVHGLWEQWNYYAGIRAIVVWRGGEGAWRAQPGIEGQITYDLNDWFGIGLRGTYDKCGDEEEKEIERDEEIEDLKSQIDDANYTIKEARSRLMELGVDVPSLRVHTPDY
jgi:hypothetical protein